MALGLSRRELESAARFEINRAQFKTGDVDAITRAIAVAIEKNNEKITRDLMAAGVQISARRSLLTLGQFRMPKRTSSRSNSMRVDSAAMAAAIAIPLVSEIVLAVTPAHDTLFKRRGTMESLAVIYVGGGVVTIVIILIILFLLFGRG
jgi:hypothetical protein